MQTNHKLLFQDSRDLSNIKDKSVNLTVTSPPYPMIEMWDELFINQNNEIGCAIKNSNGNEAFELMHQELDKVWNEVARVTKDGGFVAINIGDATRKIGTYFQLYSNHTRITSKFIELGFDVLPLILWKKTANSPNKFMGSGMLPAGAYITLEHEYILIFRKGHKREFLTKEQKKNRNESAFFWEERNIWFSNIWDLKGIKQNLSDDSLRKRSAAYTIELPYRLISMYSCKGDTILDPFLGTGTTIFASAILERNSIGVEIQPNFLQTIQNNFNAVQSQSFELCQKRINNHLEFIEKYKDKKGNPKYTNIHHDFEVITSQEVEILFNTVSNIKYTNNEFVVSYHKVGYENNKPFHTPNILLSTSPKTNSFSRLL
jgi:modification methylase